jgi:hypothetical protein
MTALNTLIAASIEGALNDAAQSPHAKCYRELMRMRDVFPCAEMFPDGDDEWLSAWRSSHDADGFICPDCVVERGIKAVRDSYAPETQISEVLTVTFKVENGYALPESDLEVFVSTVDGLLFLAKLRKSVNSFANKFIRRAGVRSRNIKAMPAEESGAM